MLSLQSSATEQGGNKKQETTALWGWSWAPGWAREAVEVYSAARSVILDVFSLENASILNAVRRGLAPGDAGPAGEAAWGALRGVVQAQRVLLDLAHRQNGIFRSALTGVLPPATPVVDAVSAAVDTLVDAHQGFLAIAERRVGAWLPEAQEATYAADAAREALEQLADTRDQLLAKSGTRARPGLSELTGQSVEAFSAARADLLRIARRQARSAVRAMRRALDSTLPAVDAADLRTAAEYVLLHATPVYYGIGVPPGDASAVLLIPGFLSSDLYLLELYAWLRRIGYRPYFSGIGLNAECPDLLVKNRLNPTIDRALQETGRPIHIIGHSLGGIIARSVACQRPADVASVITLGAPFRDGGVMRSRVLQAAEIVRRRILLEHGPRVLDTCYTGQCSCDFVSCATCGLPDSVAHTAVYARSDRVIDWQYCRTGNPKVDVEVSGTHAGLAVNPMVYEAIGGRLVRAGRAARPKSRARRSRRTALIRVHRRAS